MKKIFSLIIAVVAASTMFLSVSFADTTSQEDWDKINSTQAVTQQSQSEISASNEKVKDAQVLLDTIKKYKAKKATKNELDNAANNFSKKYNVKLNLDDISGQKSKGIMSMAATTTDSNTLGFSCYRQEKDWYCGPASAYIILKGMGATSWNGLTLSQDHLADCLNAKYSGAGWPGTWSNTLVNWSARSYATINAPTSAYLLYYAYLDTRSAMGSIYDTHMYGNIQLPGYTSGTERYHYVAGDGYDNTNSQVHYLDPHNTNNSAYGPHWVSAATMANCVYDRGMVW